MILVDTSVWVAALRNAACAESRTLAALLDADEVALAVPVRVELLSGAARRNGESLRRALSALPVLYPTEETWKTIGTWTERAVDAGDHFGMGDLLIGAVAAENGALIWSLDDD